MTSVPQSRLFMVALVALTFLGAIDHTIVSTSLPRLASDLGAVEHLSWIVVGYTLSATVFVPVFGRLGDRFGPRRMLLVATGIFTVGSLQCGFAWDIASITAFRIWQGIGSAGMHLLPQVIIGAVVPARQRPQLMSWVGAAFPVAMVIGPLAGGVITDVWGWPWVFWVNVPLGLVTMALAVRGIPVVPGLHRGGFDYAGTALVALLTVGLVLASTWGAGDLGWAAPQTLGALAIVGVTLAALWPIERRAASPVLPLSVLRHRTVAIATILSVIVGVGLFAVVAYLPTYIQLGYLVSASVSGVVPMAMMFGLLAGTLASGRIVSRTGRYRRPAITGTVVGALGLFVMAVLPPSLGVWAPALVMGVVGIGVGSFMQLVVTVAQSGAPREQIGTVTALLTLSRQILSTTASALVGAWIGARVAAGAPAGLSANDLTYARVSTQPAAVQQEVSVLLHQTLLPVFLVLSVVFVVGVCAALRLSHEELSEEPVTVAHRGPVPQTSTPRGSTPRGSSTQVGITE